MPKFGRKFVGIELKESYFRSACRNIRQVEHDTRPMDLFNFNEEE